MFWNCSVLVDEIYKWLVLSLVISTFILHVIILPVGGFSLVIWPSVIDPLTQQWWQAVYSKAKTDMLTGNASFSVLSLNCCFAGIIFSERALLNLFIYVKTESYKSIKKDCKLYFVWLISPSLMLQSLSAKKIKNTEEFACSLALWQCCGAVKVSESKIMVLFILCRGKTILQWYHGVCPCSARWFNLNSFNNK